MFALSRFSFAMTTSEVRHTRIENAFVAHNARTFAALPGIKRGAAATH
jgi:hypothetical protein